MIKKNILFLFFFLVPILFLAQTQKQPVAKFSFNNGANEDEINKHPAKLIGAKCIQDRFGNDNNAVYLSGTESSYINLGNYTELKPECGSISLWIKLEHKMWAGTGTEYNPILVTKARKSNDFYEAYGIYYMLQTGRCVALTTKDSTKEVLLFCTDPFEKNAWHHLVITYSYSKMSFYVDGILESTLPKKFTSTFLASDSVLIGSTGSKKNKRYLNAMVDDIEFYNQELSGQDVLKLYNAPNPNKNKIILNWFLVGMAIFLCCVLFYYLIKYQVKKGILKEKQRLELNNKLLETELRVNRASMNPHFLFNSLNALHNFILNNENDNASNYLITFSKLIRKILDSNMHESISLELEIELMDLYMEIENLRFEENIKYLITTDDSLSATSVHIPIMMLQPFVENAIWHGLLNKKGEKIITISFSLFEEKYIYCVIEDNGLGRKKISGNIIEKKSLATGFIIQRLELLNKIHNLKCSLLIEDKPNNKGTIVKIILPILNK